MRKGLKTKAPEVSLTTLLEKRKMTFELFCKDISSVKQFESMCSLFGVKMSEEDKENYLKQHQQIVPVADVIEQAVPVVSSTFEDIIELPQTSEEQLVEKKSRRSSSKKDV